MASFKLVCFDLDGCLTEKDDSWAYIHHHLGVWEQAQEHRRQFFRGEIDYQRWADLDVGLWRGTPVNEIKKIVGQIKVRPNIELLVQELKNKTLYLGILSSGLSFFADSVKKQYNFDFAIANSLKVGEDGRLTGEINVEVSFDDKDYVLEKFLKPFNIKMKDCIAIGDGENDIPLFNRVGFSIAFNPKNQKVANSATTVVQSGDLLEVLSIILEKL